VAFVRCKSWRVYAAPSGVPRTARRILVAHKKLRCVHATKKRAVGKEGHVCQADCQCGGNAASTVAGRYNTRAGCGATASLRIYIEKAILHSSGSRSVPTAQFSVVFSLTLSRQHSHKIDQSSFSKMTSVPPVAAMECYRVVSRFFFLQDNVSSTEPSVLTHYFPVRLSCGCV
jgi:hypothetical protein